MLVFGGVGKNCPGIIGVVFFSMVEFLGHDGAGGSIMNDFFSQKIVKQFRHHTTGALLLIKSHTIHVWYIIFTYI